MKKFLIPIGKAILMFLVSTIIIGAAIIINWKRTVLTVTIGGETYHFVSANGMESPYINADITETVFESEMKSRVTVQRNQNFFYDPCDEYTVEIQPSAGPLIRLAYEPNKAIIELINAANAGQNQPFIPDKAIEMTFYYGDRDITGFTQGATINNLLSEEQESETLPAIDAGNDIVSRQELGLSGDAIIALESITAFRNYKPFGKAIMPIYIWVPVFVFAEYGLLGIFNMSRDIYRKIKNIKSKKTKKL